MLIEFLLPLIHCTDINKKDGLEVVNSELNNIKVNNIDGSPNLAINFDLSLLEGAQVEGTTETTQNPDLLSKSTSHKQQDEMIINPTTLTCDGLIGDKDSSINLVELENTKKDASVHGSSHVVVNNIKGVDIINYNISDDVINERFNLHDYNSASDNLFLELNIAIGEYNTARRYEDDKFYLKPLETAASNFVQIIRTYKEKLISIQSKPEDLLRTEIIYDILLQEKNEIASFVKQEALEKKAFLDRSELTWIDYLLYLVQISETIVIEAVKKHLTAGLDQTLKKYRLAKKTTVKNYLPYQLDALKHAISKLSNVIEDLFDAMKTYKEINLDIEKIKGISDILDVLKQKIITYNISRMEKNRKYLNIKEPRIRQILVSLYNGDEMGGNTEIENEIKEIAFRKYLKKEVEDNKDKSELFEAAKNLQSLNDEYKTAESTQNIPSSEFYFLNRFEPLIMRAKANTNNNFSVLPQYKKYQTSNNADYETRGADFVFDNPTQYTIKAPRNKNEEDKCANISKRISKDDANLSRQNIKVEADDVKNTGTCNVNQKLTTDHSEVAAESGENSKGTSDLFSSKNVCFLAIIVSVVTAICILIFTTVSYFSNK